MQPVLWGVFQYVFWCYFSCKQIIFSKTHRTMVLGNMIGFKGQSLLKEYHTLAHHFSGLIGNKNQTTKRITGERADFCFVNGFCSCLLTTCLRNLYSWALYPFALAPICSRPYYLPSNLSPKYVSCPLFPREAGTCRRNFIFLLWHHLNVLNTLCKGIHSPLCSGTCCYTGCFLQLVEVFWLKFMFSCSIPGSPELLQSQLLYKCLWLNPCSTIVVRRHSFSHRGTRGRKVHWWFRGVKHWRDLHMKPLVSYKQFFLRSQRELGQGLGSMSSAYI